jgi:hypothetical protein
MDLAAAKTLIGGLAPDERARVLEELTKAFRPIPQPRSGSDDVLAEIVRLLPEQRSWTVEQIKQRVESRRTSRTQSHLQRVDLFQAAK